MGGYVAFCKWTKDNLDRTKGICYWVSINTLNWSPRSTSWSILDRHPDRCLDNTLSTLDQQSVDSRPSVDCLLWIDQKLVDSWATVDWDVDGVSIEYQSRVWIDTRPQMPLVHMIYFLSVYSVNSLWRKPKTNWIVKRCIQYVLLSLLLDIQSKDMTTSFKKIWPTCSVINYCSGRSRIFQ